VAFLFGAPFSGLDATTCFHGERIMIQPIAPSQPILHPPYHPWTFTSESVTEGHPDKVCDFISDSILDACLSQEKNSRVACETLCKGGVVVVAGEVTSKAALDLEVIVSHAIHEIGYVDDSQSFSADNVHVIHLLTQQASEIAAAVDSTEVGSQGAGDQGMMFGYATDETPELMPLPILLAHRLAQTLAQDRKTGLIPWLRPDGKTQVSVVYDGIIPVRVSTVLVSAQHAPGVDLQTIQDYVVTDLAPRALGRWHSPETEFIVNPSGSFVTGGPEADCGLTGRKIIVDTYGGAAHHGGGAFSGKDPSKVDRSGAYFCRYVARQIVLSGIAKKAEIQVAYAIGRSKPVSIKVDMFGTGDSRAAEQLVGTFDFRPAAIIERLDLLRPIYRLTTNYGHFGKSNLPWER
jgi:S-adenosylmethionine synthetase